MVVVVFQDIGGKRSRSVTLQRPQQRSISRIPLIRPSYLQPISRQRVLRGGPWVVLREAGMLLEEAKEARLRWRTTGYPRLLTEAPCGGCKGGIGSGGARTKECLSCGKLEKTRTWTRVGCFQTLLLPLLSRKHQSTLKDIMRRVFYHIKEDRRFWARRRCLGIVTQGLDGKKARKHHIK